MDNGFRYLAKNALALEKDYPYTAKDGTCKHPEGKTHVSHYTDVARGSVSQLQAAVAGGPVSIAIEADQRPFQAYKSGVLQSSCGKKLDHGVLAVGYGTEGGVDYWLVKNSWGPAWGDQGYIKIKRDSSDLCGILD